MAIAVIIRFVNAAEFMTRRVDGVSHPGSCMDGGTFARRFLLRELITVPFVRGANEDLGQAMQG